jgi:hypothetical protein
MYIKPWDSHVFKNFFVCLQTINELMTANEQKVEICVSIELYKEYQTSDLLRKLHGLEKF